MTKEFLVKQQESKETAMAALCDMVVAYEKKRQLPNWEWHTRPEAMFGPDGWRAYCRIKWSST